MPKEDRSEYNKKRRKMLFWGYTFVGVALVVFALFVFRIIHIQNANTQELKDNVISKNYREAILKAARGNLFASDGSILATTIMKYNIFIDFKTMRDTLYKNNMKELSDSLSLMFGKRPSYFTSIFAREKRSKNQYYSLVRGLDFDEYDRIRKFPVFSYGKSKSGFIVERSYSRELASSKIGLGTIGIDEEYSQSGFEGAFSNYLKGVDGTRLEQKINSRQWKPIDYWKVNEPIDGMDVYTSLDIRIQDIVHSALKKQLVAFDADHGSVVVMERHTGKVRAMVNLRRTSPETYVDTYNYAIKDAIETGSIFKPVSLLAAIDDGFVNENTKINIGGSYWVYAGQRITDTHEGDMYNISDILAYSSNIGIAKVITEHYSENPNIFFNHLRRWKLFDKMNIDFSGIAHPKIITPEHKRWNKATLASISYGYSTNISQLQLATFYNGIANGGKMLKPLFIDKIMKDGRVVYVAKPEVMLNKMASDKAIKMLTNALVQAVERGTAKSIYTPNLKIAGKTGTSRFEYWKEGPMKYISSFAGFFPADDPKYTCIVFINQPDPKKGFYGSMVAAPVFKEIAGKIFLKTPINAEILPNSTNLKASLQKEYKKILFVRNEMPNLVGLPGMNVISELENLGYRVHYTGAGKVLEQFPLQKTKIKTGQKIYLKLQN